MNHLLKLRPGDARFLFALFIDEMDLLGDVARAEQQHAFTRQTIAASAPCLLIIALEIFRQIKSTTKRTFGLLMPIPNAIVAVITRTSSRRNDSWCFVRSAAVSPA